jgi:hypothetical protein
MQHLLAWVEERGCPVVLLDATDRGALWCRDRTKPRGRCWRGTDFTSSANCATCAAAASIRRECQPVYSASRALRTGSRPLKNAVFAFLNFFAKRILQCPSLLNSSTGC